VDYLTTGRSFANELTAKKLPPADLKM